MERAQWDCLGYPGYHYCTHNFSHTQNHKFNKLKMFLNFQKKFPNLFSCMKPVNFISLPFFLTFLRTFEPCILGTIILDINYADFLQFQQYFTPQAELEEAFIYIIHKPIDFTIDVSYRLKT